MADAPHPSGGRSLGAPSGSSALPGLTPGGGGSRFALLVLALALLSFLRQPGAYLSPILAFEDGRDVFAFYYNHPEPSGIFRFYNGYIALLPNLWGWLVMRGPVPWAPHLLALGPLLAASAAFAWFARPAFRRLVPSDRARLATTLVAAAAPLTNYLFLGNTMYSVWSLLVLLALAALAPPATTPGRAVLAVAGQGLLAWSHPLSALVVPVHGLLAVAGRRLGAWPEGTPVRLARVQHLAIAALALAYQGLGVDHESVQPPPWLETLRLTWRFLVERVVFGTVFGDAAARALRRTDHEGWIVAAAAAVLAALVAGLWLARRRFGRFERFAGLYFLWMVVGLTALFVVSRAPEESILGSDRAFRYFWTQRVLFVVLLAAVVHRLLEKRPRALAAGALALVVVALAQLNRDNRSPYAVRPGQGAAVSELTREIARQESAKGGRTGISARLERGPWTLEITR